MTSFFFRTRSVLRHNWLETTSSGLEERCKYQREITCYPMTSRHVLELVRFITRVRAYFFIIFLLFLFCRCSPARYLFWYHSKRCHLGAAFLAALRICMKTWDTSKSHCIEIRMKAYKTHRNKSVSRYTPNFVRFIEIIVIWDTYKWLWDAL